MVRGTSPVFVRKGLVILQFTISSILIIGTIIIYLQTQHIKSRDLGYSKANLMQTGLRGEMQKNFAVIKEQFLSTGYVENVAMSDLNMLYMGSNSGGYRWEGKDPSKKVLITQDNVSPEYISTAGLKIREGRDFYADTRLDSFSVIINQGLADMIGKNPIGKTIFRDTSSTGSVSYKIIGVTNDFVYGDMYGRSDPIIFFSSPQDYGYMYIRLKARIPTEKAIAKIEGIMKANNPGYPFNYVFVDEEFDKQFKTETLVGKLSKIFAVLAIIISCLGLFGLAAYTAERRTKEIGIRKVLGATITGITSLLSKEFLLLVMISALVAFPLAWFFMHNWLQNYAYRISISWWVFLLAGMLAILIALFTVSFQAIKAAIANPVKSLRTE
jgi:ABC-type antimicrobial peptide transport system permease subunit